MVDLENFQAVTSDRIHTCTRDDGTRYVRFSWDCWAQWMGESLEIINDDEDTAHLEWLYRKWSTK